MNTGGALYRLQHIRLPSSAVNQRDNPGHTRSLVVCRCKALTKGEPNTNNREKIGSVELCTPQPMMDQTLARHDQEEVFEHLIEKKNPPYMH